jgi:hypothetical protein
MAVAVDSYAAGSGSIPVLSLLRISRGYHTTRTEQLSHSPAQRRL